MNTALFIARKLANGKQSPHAAFIIRLSAGATALGVAAMIITVCFVNGFQTTVSDKVYSFWGHIRVQHYEADKSMVSEESPIGRDSSVERLIREQPGVAYLQPFVTKSAVLDKDKNIEGILLKGVDASYRSEAFKPFLTKGRWLEFNNTEYSRDLLVSDQMASLLNLGVGDTVKIYFITDSIGARTYRKLRISGTYKTGIEEYDRLFCIADMRLIQRINGWGSAQIGGYEVFAENPDHADSLNYQLLASLPMEWMSRNIASIYPNLFDWLSIQDVNRDVVFIIMGIVALINLITCLLILILERTQMIGLLKALGARDSQVIRIFVHYAGYIALRGIGIGTALGLGLCLLQQYTGFIRLDESAYYVSRAPIQIIWWQIVLICAVTTAACYMVLIIPALLVRTIRPTRALRFR